MIDDPNIEYEDKPEVDEDGNPIWYMPTLPDMDEFTSYKFNTPVENIPNGYYESVWSTSATSKTRATGEQLANPIDVILENTDDYKDDQGQLNVAEDKYNAAADKIVEILTNVLQKGKITGEDNAEFLAAQHELSIYSTKIKELCNKQEKESYKNSVKNIKDSYQATTASKILDILTEGGTKPWIYMDDNNNVLLDGTNIPELTVLAQKLNLIATDGKDNDSRLTLTPEFIEMVVEQTGSSDGIKDVLTKYYLSTSTTELIGGTWLDTLPSTDEQQGKYLWYKMVTIYNDPNKEPKEADPICIAAQSGTTTYTWIRYADDVNGNGISNDPTGKKYIGFAYNKTTMIESNIASDYTWSLIQGEKGDTGVPGATGEDGKTYYTWIRYSDNADGTDMYDIPKDSTKYIGIAVNKETQAESSNKADYTWSKFKGEDGQDGTGINIIDKLTSTSQLPTTGNKGDAYTVNGVLYVWSDDINNWVDCGNIKGEQGEPGANAYLHIKYSDDGKTFTANNGETVGAYIGIYTDNIQVDSTNFNDYTWTRIRGDQGLQGLQGEKGEQGIQGPPGKDGDNGKTTYFHIKYSPNSNGNPMTEVPSEYIGTYVDYNQTDSTDYTKYKWARFQGLQGEQGIPGNNGNDGQTYYLHIKYSNDGGKTFTSNNGETPGTYIGVYTDTTQNDSTSVSKYTWSKIKGEQGNQGPQGIPGDDGRGVEDVKIEYAKNQSTTTAPTSGWSTTMPSYQEGYYLWYRTGVKYTDSSNYVYGNPVCDETWKLNKEVLTQYKQLADKFTWLVKSGTSQSNMVLTDKLFELISQNITLTAEHINLNGYINANGGNFSVDEQGNIEANDLNVHGTLTCNDINVTNIISPSAPEGLTNSLRIDINTGVSISETLDDLPINLNGYSVNIYLNTDVAENIELRRHYAGLVNIFLCGYNLKGTIRGNFNNSAYGIYGGNSESDKTNLGAIMPYEGYKIGSYYYSVSMVNCPNVSIKNVTIYGGTTHTTYTVGIGGTRKSIIELDNITFKNCASNCRTYSMAQVYCAKSSGTSTKVGWYAGTGSTIMLNSSKQAGGSPNTNKANNSQLYADEVTFDGSGTTVTPPVHTPHTTTRTATFKPVSGGTYRYTLYNNWRKDNVVRQGKWGTTSGNCAGAWFYGSQFDEVIGKNITKVVISVSRSEGVGNSASCAHSFQAHTHISRPSGEPNFTTCNKSISLSWGQSGTITITDEAVLTGISEGTIKGFGIKSAFDGAHYSALSNGTVKIYYTE